MKWGIVSLIVGIPSLLLSLSIILAFTDNMAPLFANAVSLIILPISPFVLGLIGLFVERKYPQRNIILGIIIIQIVLYLVVMPSTLFANCYAQLGCYR